MRKIKYIFLIIPVLLLTVSCRSKKTGDPVISTPVDLKEIVKADTLRIATMYGSTSYFMFRDEMMGFDYDMAQNLANYLHLNLKISIAQTEKDMYRMLEERRVDVICYNVIQTKELKKQFSFVLPQPSSYQVLVQNLSANSISEVTDLVGKTIYVRENSIYHQRLKFLSDEIGGVFNIKFAPDSLTDDDLIDMVAENKIEYTVAYHNVALLHKSYYRNIDCRMPVGFEQKNGWVIRNESKLLKNTIEKWQEWAVQAEPETIQHFFGFLMRQEDGEIHELAETNQLNETMIRFLGWALIDALVPARVKDSSFWEHEAKWKRNYCPVCGRQAALAQLRKEQQGRARYLSCDGCHTVWPHKRIGCVYCQNIDLKKMHILEPEGEPEMRLDVCDECHTYLKTYNEEGAEDVYLRDWATIHLDLLGEEQGLRKKGSVLLASE